MHAIRYTLSHTPKGAWTDLACTILGNASRPSIAILNACRYPSSVLLHLPGPFVSRSPYPPHILARDWSKSSRAKCSTLQHIAFGGSHLP